MVSGYLITLADSVGVKLFLLSSLIRFFESIYLMFINESFLYMFISYDYLKVKYFLKNVKKYHLTVDNII